MLVFKVLRICHFNFLIVSLTCNNKQVLLRLRLLPGRIAEICKEFMARTSIYNDIFFFSILNVTRLKLRDFNIGIVKFALKLLTRLACIKTRYSTISACYDHRIWRILTFLWSSPNPKPQKKLFLADWRRLLLSKFVVCMNV